MNVSNYLADALLNMVFRNTAWTRPTNVYVALYKTNPTAADTGTEVSGGAYARQTIVFEAPEADGGKETIKNSAEIQFPVATADWGLITHVGIRTALSAGNLLYFGALVTPRTINEGERFIILVDNGIVRLS